jgi:formylglycine-generating enzyme required for sulfatase activity
MGRGIRPAINVSWDDAQRYVAWLSRMTGKTYRLLTEAEFEYVARAGRQNAYSWSDEIGHGNANRRMSSQPMQQRDTLAAVRCG